MCPYSLGNAETERSLKYIGMIGDSEVRTFRLEVAALFHALGRADRISSPDAKFY